MTVLKILGIILLVIIGIPLIFLIMFCGKFILQIFYYMIEFIIENILQFTFAIIFIGIIIFIITSAIS